MNVEVRSATLYQPESTIEFRSEGSPVILGYAALFNIVADIGPFRERIKPGAFQRAISEGQDVRALVNHDRSLILGRTKSKTLELAESVKGLRIKILPPDTTVGRDAMTSLKRGDLDQMSFAFIARKSTWIEEKGKTPIRQLEDVVRGAIELVCRGAGTTAAGPRGHGGFPGR